MTDAFSPAAPELPGPPEFPQVEEQLIAIVLHKPALIEYVADTVAPEYFLEESYGRIWGVYLDMYRRDIPISATSVIEPIASEVQWSRAETMKLFIHLMNLPCVPVSSQVRYLGEMVRDLWQRRAVYFLAHDMLKRTQGGLDNRASKIIEESEAALYHVAQTGAADTDHSYVFSEAIAIGLAGAHAAARRHEAGELVGCPTGLTVIDNKLGGFRNSDLIILGSRPGMGKSAMANRFARAAAEQFVSANAERPEWVMFFSLEMGADQLAMRQVAAEARVNFERIRLGHCDTQELMALEAAGQTIRDLPIHIDDSARLSVSAMRTRVRRWSRKRGRVGLILIDYLQLIGLSREEMREAGGNRVQEVSTITRSLKNLAKDLDVPVVCLAQLNRDVEKREDKRPMLSDLRESGTIEQDADIVAFLYREHYYLSKKPPGKQGRENDMDHQQRKVEWSISCDAIRDEGEFIVAKNRHGSEGTIKLKFHRELMLWDNDTPGGAGGDPQEQRKRQLAMELDDRIT